MKPSEDTEGIVSAYQRMMEESDAKYKVYLHQDVFIINENFIIDILSIFEKYPQLGMLGVVGAKTIPNSCKWWEGAEKFGKVYDSHTGQMERLAFNDIYSDYEKVHAIDGLIMVTQYDLPWRKDLFKGWHFYDLSQSLEFVKSGYEVGVAKQNSPWCIHDCGVRILTSDYERLRETFYKEYYRWLNKNSERNWNFYDPEFEYKKDYPLIDQYSAWLGHRRFAYDLVRFMKPAAIVELGTHWGISFFSFLQAVKDGGMSTACYAVDTWQGDTHAGFYGEDVYQTVSQIAHQYYQNQSTLIRSTFDEALNHFEEQSIDWLHIDGYHTYEAVAHDFESWLPKLAEKGIILFHDIVVKCDDFGVYQLWDQLKCQYPALEFSHSYGLGVLFPKGYHKDFEKLFQIKDILQDTYASSY
ncbi:hypothetical protein JOD45_003137 [Scopulibacillus daqui]|uniref:Streptomycin biosynthesis protein StrF domain-containing protein n=1 Tax=Scopulibacillus daqui TaxID=1469162 RepID=A0ABS2Q3M8_9BACL|nr:hypothetical protein [Scopulibacillus daqui]